MRGSPAASTLLKNSSRQGELFAESRLELPGMSRGSLAKRLTVSLGAGRASHQGQGPNTPSIGTAMRLLRFLGDAAKLGIKL